MATIEIVRAGENDAAALTKLALSSKASNGYDDAFMEQCREELTVTTQSLANCETWKAVDTKTGKLLGCFSLQFAGRLAELHSMFVSPSSKRSGVGSALWVKMERVARLQNAERIELDSDPFAVAFYEAKGMSVCGQVPSGSIPGRTLPRMGKDLR